MLIAHMGFHICVRPDHFLLSPAAAHEGQDAVDSVAVDAIISNVLFEDGGERDSIAGTGSDATPVECVLHIVHRGMMRLIIDTFVVVVPFLARNIGEEVGADFAAVSVSQQVFFLQILELGHVVDRKHLLRLIDLAPAHNVELGNVLVHSKHFRGVLLRAFVQHLP